MAFNNWDKLAKAQRDYPKLKAAVPFVEKQLKRNASNPYLLTWKADLALQRNMNPKDVAEDLLKIHHSIGADTQLLSYLYRLYFEATRRGLKGGICQNSIGQDALKIWQGVAKKLQRAEDRMELWDLLFKSALREDAWEDIRYAIVNYTKEGPSNKKHFHFLLTLATKVSADQQVLTAKKDDRSVKFAYTIALQYMKKSFNAPPGNPVAVENIRDLRFMIELFKDSDQFEEIFSLWENPPEAIIPLLKRHRDDLLPLMIRIAKQRCDWALVERLCLTAIDEKLALQSESGNSGKHIWELCAWRWDLWDALLKAVEKTQPEKEAHDLIRKVTNKCFGDELKEKDRPFMLAYMALRQFTGEHMLPLCKEYFKNHSHLPSCFGDLRPFLSKFPAPDMEDFIATIRVESGQALSWAADANAVKAGNLQATLTLLKVQYMCQVSRTWNQDIRVWHGLFRIALSFWQKLWPQNLDVGYLVIYLLLNIHHRTVHTFENKNPLETTLNSRILLQATMLARHLVTKDKDQNDKVLALFASRLHLNLGLGTIAFRFWRNVKSKEMLVDTISPWILSRISQTHPFDVKGYGGFSADEELQHVIETIERMERKTDDVLTKNMSSFNWDTVMGILEIKHKLRSSLTKHLCFIERKRIARLRGESVENVPTLDFNTYKEISDHWERSIFPDFECERLRHRSGYLVMPNGPPNLPRLFEQHFTQEKLSAELYRESRMLDFDCQSAKFDNDIPDNWPDSNLTRIEKRLKVFWDLLYTINVHVFIPENHGDDTLIYTTLLESVFTMRKTLERLRMPGKTSLAPQDEPTMFHENMLITLYGEMEVCKAIVKLVEHIREQVLKPKSKSKVQHPMKSKLPENYDIDLLQQTEICFNAAHNVAQSYIDLLQKRGIQAITAQVRWGPTGEWLREMLSDDDVEYYAREYVDSAVEAWRGVLKVRLK